MMHNSSCQPQYVKCGYCGREIDASRLKFTFTKETEEIIQAGVNPVFMSVADYSIPPFAFCPYCNNCITMKGFKY